MGRGAGSALRGPNLETHLSPDASSRPGPPAVRPSGRGFVAHVTDPRTPTLGSCWGRVPTALLGAVAQLSQAHLHPQRAPRRFRPERVAFR